MSLTDVRLEETERLSAVGEPCGEMLVRSAAMTSACVRGTGDRGDDGGRLVSLWKSAVEYRVG